MCVTPSSPLTQVRLQEMRESLRIVYQCINEMPNGLFKSADHKVGWSGVEGGIPSCRHDPMCVMIPRSLGFVKVCMHIRMNIPSHVSRMK